MFLARYHLSRRFRLCPFRPHQSTGVALELITARTVVGKMCMIDVENLNPHSMHARAAGCIQWIAAGRYGMKLRAD